MPQDYGMKVSQPGYDVKTATPSQLVFSSKYSTLRIKSQGSGIVTDSGGRIATIAHNLGYIPVFLVHTTTDPFFESAYYGDSDDYYINPIIPTAVGACNINNRDVNVWADTTNIYIEVGSEFGWLYYYTGLEHDNYAEQWNGGWTNGYSRVGHDDVLGNDDGAVRFTNINIGQGTSVYSAFLDFWVDWRDGSDTIYTTVYGIDEDNTNDFSSNPFSRTKTGHSVSSNYGSADEDQFWGSNVKAIVNEILGRGGWSGGNAMGFFMFNNGTTGDNNLGTYLAGDNCVYCSCTNLKILVYNALLNYKYTIFYNRAT